MNLPFHHAFLLFSQKSSETIKKNIQQKTDNMLAGNTMRLDMSIKTKMACNGVLPT